MNYKVAPIIFESILFIRFLEESTGADISGRIYRSPREPLHDSRKTYRRFRENLSKIPGETLQDSVRDSFRFRKNLSKIPGESLSKILETNLQYFGRIYLQDYGRISLQNSARISPRFRNNLFFVFSSLWNNLQEFERISSIFERRKIPENIQDFRKISSGRIPQRFCKIAENTF